MQQPKKIYIPSDLENLKKDELIGFIRDLIKSDLASREVANKSMKIAAECAFELKRACAEVHGLRRELKAMKQNTSIEFRMN